MENKKDKIALNDDQLDNVSGGYEDEYPYEFQQEVRTEVPDGTTCPDCNGAVVRVTVTGSLGPFGMEKTWRECSVCKRYISY